MSYKAKTIQDDFIEFVSKASCDFDTAISLTFAIEPPDRNQAIQTFREFINELNKDCYGNNWQRRAKHHPSAHIAIVPVLEDGFGTKRMHYHCIAKKPSLLHAWQFEILVVMHWAERHLGGKYHNKIEDIWDKKGWAGYMSNELTLNHADIIDEKNIHIY